MNSPWWVTTAVLSVAQCWDRDEWQELENEDIQPHRIPIQVPLHQLTNWSNYDSASRRILIIIILNDTLMMQRVFVKLVCVSSDSMRPWGLAWSVLRRFADGSHSLVPRCTVSCCLCHGAVRHQRLRVFSEPSWYTRGWTRRFDWIRTNTGGLSLHYGIVLNMINYCRLECI